MCDTNIITLYKNNGDLSDCNNHCGISLLNTVGKVFARVISKPEYNQSYSVVSELAVLQWI